MWKTVFAIVFCIHFVSCKTGTSVSELDPPSPTTIATPPQIDLEDSDVPYMWNRPLEQAWKEFVRGSNYRVARLNDMQFSDQAKSLLVDLHMRFWKSQYSTNKGLAVIVVDVTKTESNRFGLVVFRPGYHSNTETYKPYWLFRDRDLSRSALQQISSTLKLYEMEDDGSYKYCEIEWNRRREEYICIPTYTSPPV
jgi:hypothetical protein